jgi:hypothetical protein
VLLLGCDHEVKLQGAFSQPCPLPNALALKIVQTMADLWNADSKPRYLRFTTLLTGHGSVYLPADSTAVCSRGRFQPMRDVAFSQAGIQHIAVRHQPKIKVTYLDTQPGERRTIVNLHELVAAMQRRFPAVKMNIMLPQSMAAEEQMRELSDTTILVSNVGSRSFRLVFLPDGGRALLVGAPELEHGLAYTHDKELTCWAHIGYVTAVMYRVFDKADYTPGRQRPIPSYNMTQAEMVKKLAWQTRMQIWDADIKVNEQRFGDLLEEELSNIERERMMQLEG